MTRVGLAIAAMLLTIAPTLALDGQPAMQDPSTVIETGGSSMSTPRAAGGQHSSRTTAGRGAGRLCDAGGAWRQAGTGPPFAAYRPERRLHPLRGRVERQAA